MRTIGRADDIDRLSDSAQVGAIRTRTTIIFDELILAWDTKEWHHFVAYMPPANASSSAFQPNY